MPSVSYTNVQALEVSMGKVERTVFISYRRKDISWALLVYKHLTANDFDVFFDYTSIPSGDFEQIIISNIKARAHFLIILTPTALDRCDESDDWLRREIETAINEKRNIVPIFFDGFSFGLPSVSKRLTGLLGTIRKYNGLEVPSSYFDEAMDRLRYQYLNVELDSVLHPVSDKVQKVVKEQQVAANEAVLDSEEPKQEFAERIKNLVRSKGKLLLVISSVITLFLFGYFIKVVAPFPALPLPTENTATLGISSATATSTDLPTKNPPSPTPTLGVGSTMISEKDDMVMVYVPAGEFQMGSENGGRDEKPVHTVYLDAFWIGQTEVTNAMYTRCVTAGECDSPSSTISSTRDNYYGNPEFDEYPVINVSWTDAYYYCKWAKNRLPTEAEWEKAAGWDDDTQSHRVYPWGGVIDDSYANYNQNVGDTTPVGSYEKGASFHGAYDMAGNVWEWVYDLYDENYYSISPFSNPMGTYSGIYRMLRGGAWDYSDHEVRSAYRYSSDPENTYNNVGFRCYLSAAVP